MIRKYILLYVCIFCGNISFGQLTNKKGVIVSNSPSFKYFAVLMRDTVLNQFSSSFLTPESKTTPFKLPAVVVDSLLFFICEEKLLHPDSTVSFYYYTKKIGSSERLKRKVKKYIRLYSGYEDLNRKYKSVVVQFVTSREYRRKKYIYSEGQFLVAGQKTLRFAIISNVGR